MSAVVVATAAIEGLKAINAAFALIASMRRQGMTNEEINARFDAVDAGGEAVTIDEVQAANDLFQQHLDAAKQIS